jgi:hypothetical protein
MTLYTQINLIFNFEVPLSLNFSDFQLKINKKMCSSSKIQNGGCRQDGGENAV